MTDVLDTASNSSDIASVPGAIKRIAPRGKNSAPVDLGDVTERALISNGYGSIRMSMSTSSGSVRHGRYNIEMPGTSSLARLTHSAVEQVKSKSALETVVDAEQSLEEQLAKLPPAARWKLIAEKRTRTIYLLAAAVIAAVYASLPSLAGFLPYLELISRPAMAQEVNGPVETIHRSGMLNQQDVILVLLAIFVIGAFLMMSFAKSAAKIKSADDVLKMALGIVVGFFSGKAT